MGEIEARAFYDKQAGEPDNGFVSVEDAKAAISQIYHDLGSGQITVGDLSDGPGAVKPFNGAFLRYDSRLERWVAAAPGAAPLAYRGAFVDMPAVALALPAPNSGDFVITTGDGHLHVYTAGATGGVWNDIGPTGSTVIPNGTADGQVLVWKVPPGQAGAWAAGDSPATVPDGTADGQMLVWKIPQAPGGTGAWAVEAPANQGSGVFYGVVAPTGTGTPAPGSLWIVAQAVGVAAGAPGTWTPAAEAPANAMMMKRLGALGQTTAWTTGQYVVLGDGAEIHWDGNSWATGRAP